MPPDNQFRSVVGQSIIIRRPHKQDAQTLFQLRKINPYAARFQDWNPGFKLDDMLLSIEGQKDIHPDSLAKNFQFTVSALQTDRIIGEGFLRTDQLDPSQVELGVLMDLTSKTGQDSAFECIAFLLNYLFKNRLKNKVKIFTEPENHSYIFLLESLGMRKEALFKENKLYNNYWQDEYMFGILKAEWPEKPIHTF